MGDYNPDDGTDSGPETLVLIINKTPGNHPKRRKLQNYYSCYAELHFFYTKALFHRGANIRQPLKHGSSSFIWQRSTAVNSSWS